MAIMVGRKTLIEFAEALEKAAALAREIGDSSLTKIEIKLDTSGFAEQASEISVKAFQESYVRKRIPPIEAQR